MPVNGKANGSGKSTFRYDMIADILGYKGPPEDLLEYMEFLSKGGKPNKKGGKIKSKYITGGITKEQAAEIFSKAEKRKERTESRKSQRIKNYNTKKKIKKYVNSVRNALYNL